MRAKQSARLYHGSSPRARGTGHCLALITKLKRFIPACAGNSPPPAAVALPQSVHPRVRGEQRASSILKYTQAGSSPRARGTGSCALGIDRQKAVHPRVRGEQLLRGHIVTIEGGSSPRARGTAVLTVLNFIKHRFIPACAGNRPLHQRQLHTYPVHPRVRGEQFRKTV